MSVTYMPLIDHRGAFSHKRMHLQPVLPMPVNYATAAIPTFAPFGTEYTPTHTLKIVGGRNILVPNSMASIPEHSVQSSKKYLDPALAPTKAIQNIHAHDNSQWQQQSRARFDTTYRTEFINRIRHPDHRSQVNRTTKSSINQYSVLPPISTTTTNNYVRNGGSASSVLSNIQRPIKDQEVPSNETISKNIPPLNLNNITQNFHDQQQQQQQPMMNNEDIYLPEEPVLLTDYEEERLSEQIRNQLGNSTTVEKLKLFYQELSAYDRNVTGYVHYSNIQLVASQLGLNLQEDTLRFAMCKFVLPERGRGYVNYEDMIRYFGKCLSSINPNQYGQQRNLSSKQNDYDNQSLNTQKQNQTQMRFGNSVINDDDSGNFDPDERQIQNLLKQNLKYFDMNGSIDFDKLNRELKVADKNQSGVLNRQQIEEVVYKVRIPLQRSLTFQILEKHCKAYSGLYKWEAFIQYLKEQVLDLKDVQDRSSPIYKQHILTRNQWLDLMRREYNEKDRLRIIERYIKHNEGPRLESNHPTAWFTRFLRFTNAMYGHRTSTNREQDFVLPREEARRVFRAYNHVWDLKIDEDRLQRVLDACARNGNTWIDDALKLFAKQT